VSEQSQEQVNQGQGEGRGFPIAFLLGLGVVIVLLLAVWAISSREVKQEAPAKLAFGEAEQAYARRIRFTDIQRSRAANFLGQQVTIIAGYIENMGNQTIGEIEFQIEFRDLEEKVVMRESLRLFGKEGPPLESGRRREFQFNFEKVPDSWNQHPPQFQITGILFKQ
jgi:hypothetical protein